MRQKKAAVALFVGVGMLSFHQSAKAELFEIEPITWAKTPKVRPVAKKLPAGPLLATPGSKIQAPIAQAPEIKPEPPESTTILNYRSRVAQMVELTVEIEKKISEESDGETLDEHMNKIEKASQGHRESRLRDVAGFTSQIKDQLNAAKLSANEKELEKIESEASLSYTMALCVESKKSLAYSKIDAEKTKNLRDFLYTLSGPKLDSIEKAAKVSGWVNSNCTDEKPKSIETASLKNNPEE